MKCRKPKIAKIVVFGNTSQEKVIGLEFADAMLHNQMLFPPYGISAKEKTKTASQKLRKMQCGQKQMVANGAANGRADK